MTSSREFPHKIVMEKVELPEFGAETGPQMREAVEMMGQTLGAMANFLGKYAESVAFYSNRDEAEVLILATQLKAVVMHVALFATDMERLNAGAGEGNA